MSEINLDTVFQYLNSGQAAECVAYLNENNCEKLKIEISEVDQKAFATLIEALATSNLRELDGNLPL